MNHPILINQRHRKISAIDIVFLIIFGALFIILPWSYNQESMRNTGIVLFVYTFFIMKDRSWLLMLPLMFLIIPQQLNEDRDDVGIMSYSKYFRWFCCLTILLYLFFNLDCLKRQNGIVITIICSLFLLLLSLYYSIAISGSKADVIFFLRYVVLYFLFYIVVKNANFLYKYFYLALDVLFYILSFYGVLEYFFYISPYDKLYYAYVNGDFYDIISFFRVKSLCGHPLLFCAFLVVYQITLYARFLDSRNQKVLYVHYIVMIFISLLTLSRTILVIEIVVFLVNFLLRKKYFPQGKSQTLLITTLLICIGGFIFSDYIILSLDRFSDSVTSETNRLAAVEAAWAIFQNEPFGVGDNLPEMYARYQKYFPPSFTIKVLDNAFLAILCMYGIFSPLFMITFIFPFFDTYRNVGSDKKCRIIFWLTAFSFFLLSFSFIIIKYPSILMLMAANIAVINQMHHGRISNHS